MGIHPWGSNHGACFKAWHYTRDFSVLGCGIEGQDGLSTFRVKGSSDEVKLAPGPAELGTSEVGSNGLPLSLIVTTKSWSCSSQEMVMVPSSPD